MTRTRIIKIAGLVVVLLLLVASFLYVYFPSRLVKARQRLPAAPEFTVIRTANELDSSAGPNAEGGETRPEQGLGLLYDDTSLSATHEKFVTSEFRAIGFDYVCTAVEGGYSGVSPLLYLFRNPQTGTTAIYSRISSLMLRDIIIIEFTNVFEDYYDISTSNGAMPQTPFCKRRSDDLRFPRVNSIGDLYQLHLYHMQREAAHGRKAMTIKPGTEIDLYKKLGIKSGEDMVSNGIYILDPESNTYRLTSKGAFLMTMLVKTPFKQIINWSQLLRSHHIYKEFLKAKHQ